MVTVVVLAWLLWLLEGLVELGAIGGAHGEAVISGRTRDKSARPGRGHGERARERARERERAHA